MNSFPFKIVESDAVPEGTVLLVPLVTKTVVTNAMTGDNTEVLEWNPKAGAVLKNIGTDGKLDGISGRTGQKETANGTGQSTG